MDLMDLMKWIFKLLPILCLGYEKPVGPEHFKLHFFAPLVVLIFEKSGSLE